MSKTLGILPVPLYLTAHHDACAGYVGAEQQPDHDRRIDRQDHAQGRFAHLSEERIALVQQHVDERWDLLGRLEAATASEEE